MVNVTARLYVYKRNFNTSTDYRCLFAQMKKKINESLYTYTLGAKLYKDFLTYDVNSTLSTTGHHSKYNAATYPNVRGATPKLRKLMTKDPKN
ncbi:hypothetical protein V5799_010576 [Amblyomma americanum]|uniref:Uncharacterized protein n=1 Tax=Amblyomma americanum TaxID=6943 RepID=A0AAQ4EJT1_AMBAM